jgi:hypothetical protein
MGLRGLFRAASFQARCALRRLILAAVLLTCVANVNRCGAQLCGQLSGVTFTENFDNTLVNTASAQLPSTFEFAFVRSSGLSYTADNGANTNANTYSYGTTGSSERALGELTVGSVSTTIGACFTNKTNHAISSFLIGYTGEEWRLGEVHTAANLDKLQFEYSTNATSITAGTWLAVTDLDFVTPDNSGPGAKNGNAAADRTVFPPFAITPAAPIQPESTFYIHWLSKIVSGANDGLAIDDFSIGTALAPGIAGDYNNNGVVDAGDYIIWRKKLNQSVTIPNDITPGTVVQQDHAEWKQRFGHTSSDFGAGSGANIPEPATMHLAATLASIALFCLCGKHSRCHRSF